MKTMDKKHLMFLVTGIFIFVSGILYYLSSNYNQNISSIKDSNSLVIIPSEPASEPTTLEISESESEEIPVAEIKAYITGEVINPGVYTISEDARINNLVELAGGLTNNADSISVNLAEYVNDGDHIHIYSVEDKIASENISSSNLDTTIKSQSDKVKAKNILININTATLEDLKTLPSIGDTIAKNIIDYRDLNGGFKNIEEIKNVNRIGDKTFEKIKDLITK